MRWSETKRQEPNEKFLKLLRDTGMIYEDMKKVSGTKWLIEGMVGVGWNGIICGATGVGKSTIVMDMSMHLLSGKPWLGQQVKLVNTILMFQAENPDDVIQERIFRVRMNGRLSRKEVIERFIVTDKNQRYDVENTADRKQIVKLAKDFGAQVLIFDSLKKFHHRNENDPSEMDAVMDSFDQIRSKLSPKVTIFVIHHDGHAGYERGATSIRAWCDVMIGLKGKPGGHQTLTIRKTRALDWPEDIPIIGSNSSFLKKANKKKVELPVKKLLRKHYRKGCKKTELRDRLIKEIGCSRRAADEAIKISIESNDVNERQEGRCKILYV